MKILEEVANATNGPKCTSMKSVDDVRWAVHAAVATKQYGYAEDLSTLICKACVAVCPENPRSFNVDHVRSVKVRLEKDRKEKNRKEREKTRIEKKIGKKKKKR